MKVNISGGEFTFIRIAYSYRKYEKRAGRGKKQCDDLHTVFIFMIVSSRQNYFQVIGYACCVPPFYGEMACKMGKEGG